MSRRVLLRPDVFRDLHHIVIYLEQHSIKAADRFIAEVFPALQSLSDMPGKGSPKRFRSRRLKGIRSWSVPRFRNFLILYRIAEDKIDVLAVTHGSRQLRSLLMGRT